MNGSVKIQRKSSQNGLSNSKANILLKMQFKAKKLNILQKKLPPVINIKITSSDESSPKAIIR
jgi:hypothetical protein